MKEVKKLQELINREQAGKNICKYCASNAYCKEDDCMVYQGPRDTPTIQIEAEPVRHGRWVMNNQYGIKCCSECGYGQSIGAENYCPNCGAKMDDYVADVSNKVGATNDN